MVTDPQRMRRTDPGNPDVCNVYEFHKLYTDQAAIDDINSACRNARIGCVECKKVMAANLIEAMAPIHEKRRFYESRPGLVADIIAEGSRKAGQVARETMRQVRAAVKIDY